MVADYTAAEKETILKRTYNYSVCLCVIILVEFVAYIFNIPAKTHMIDGLMVYSFVVGLFFTFCIVINSLQLKGKMKKDRVKKLWKGLIPFAVAVILISVLLILAVL